MDRQIRRTDRKIRKIHRIEKTDIQTDTKTDKQTIDKSLEVRIFVCLFAGGWGEK